MKICNKGTVRERIEGYGYIKPGETKTVPDDVGRQICTGGSNLYEVKESPIPSFELEQSPPKKKKSTRKRSRGSRRKTRANK
ncbi:hypothetical protein ES705_36596 [subsurface metagenome]